MSAFHHLTYLIYCIRSKTINKRLLLRREYPFLRYLIVSNRKVSRSRFPRLPREVGARRVFACILSVSRLRISNDRFRVKLASLILSLYPDQVTREALLFLWVEPWRVDYIAK